MRCLLRHQLSQVVASTFAARMRCTAYAISSLLLAATTGVCATPEQRAIEYLSREVPRWSVENKCFSCHNNGDGARALYTAIRLRYTVPTDALVKTTEWLRRPATWNESQPNDYAKDKKLAVVQFAAALSEADEKAALIQAADLLVTQQSDDGAWHIDAENNTGSPATYGTTLATAISRQTLLHAGEERFASAIARATQWLSHSEPANILDAAAILIALPGRRDKLLTRIAQAKTSDGGWGPQRYAPAEPFDTAVVLLALQKLKEQESTRDLIRSGRAYLIAAQRASGGWPETTRPPGSQSYAQHISTSAWATLALLATNPEGQ